MVRERVVGALKPLTKYRNTVILVSAINILAQLMPPYFMGVLIDTLYPSEEQNEVIYFFIIGSILGVMLTCFFVEWLQRYLWGDLINQGAGVVRTFFFENVLNKRNVFFKEHHTGDINNKVINDAYIYAQSKLMMKPMLILNLMQILIIFAFLFMLNVYMKLITVLFSILLFVVYSLINKHLRKASVKEREAFSRLMDGANETLDGISTIQLFRVEKYFAHNFEKSVEKYEHRLSKLKLWQALSKASTNTILNVIPVAAILAGIIYLTGGGGITVGTIVSFYYFLPRLKEPIKALTDFNIDVQNAKAVESRLEALLTKEDTDESALEDIERIDTLEFKDLGYTCLDGEKILEGVNKKLTRGMCLAVTGPSGTGKTTVLRLLKQQMYPTEGEVRVNGKAYTEYNHDSYIRRISVLPQEVFVFDATLHDNIRFGEEHTEKEVREAATLSEIEHFSMDENARGISGGERQRLGLARALSRDYDVLLLDEPTSNLDQETETRIIENLKKVMEKTNCIMIVVTHSENVLKNLCTDELLLEKH